MMHAPSRTIYTNFAQYTTYDRTGKIQGLIPYVQEITCYDVLFGITNKVCLWSNSSTCVLYNSEEVELHSLSWRKFCPEVG